MSDTLCVPKLENSTRAATDVEKRTLEQSKRISIGGLLYLLFVIALLNGIVGGTIVFGLTLVLGADATVWIQRIVPAAVFAVSVGLIFGLTRELRRVRRLIERDLNAAEVVVVSATVQQWYYSHGSHSKSSFEQRREFPILVGDCGPGSRLLLTGAGLFDSATYRFEESDDHSQSPISNFNGLPVPFGFPTRECRVEYWPYSGELIAIVPAGDLVDPQDVSVNSLHSIGWKGQTVATFTGDPGLRDSESREPIELN